MMTVVERVERNVQIEGYRYDTITLGWEERRQGHGRRRSDAGVEFAVSLPSGTILKYGDCLTLTAERLIVMVAEAPEEVYVVRPGTPQEWAYYAYHAGNRHQPVMIGERDLTFLKSPAVQGLLDQIGVPYETAVRPFNAALATGHIH